MYCPGRLAGWTAFENRPELLGFSRLALSAAFFDVSPAVAAAFTVSFFAESPETRRFCVGAAGVGAAPGVAALATVGSFAAAIASSLGSERSRACVLSVIWNSRYAAFCTTAWARA